MVCRIDPKGGLAAIWSNILFVCLEGIDGAGKTTLAANLAGQLIAAGRDTVLVRKGALDTDHPEFAARLAAIGRGRWQAGLDEQTIALGELPWILYNASYYAALDSALITPALRRGQWVVIDGWFYKYALRAAHVGHRSMDHVLSLFGEIREPDRTFLLDVSPKVAAARLGEFTENEVGNGSSPGLDRTRAFMAFQSQIGDWLRELSQEREWTVIGDVAASPCTLGERLIRLLGI
jgi:thymidylate kinase